MNTDYELHRHLQKYAFELGKQDKVIDLVKMMKPLDVVRSFSTNLELHPKQAIFLLAHLIKNSPALQEWATLPLNATMNQFPVSKKNEQPLDNPANMEKTKDEIEEDYVNNLPIYNFDLNQYPPKPRPDSDGWPYDSNTLNIMDPHGHKKRPLLQSMDPLGDGEPSRAPETKPGVQGQSTFQKNQGAENPTGDMSTTGGTITVQGRPGWSSSPQGKQYNTQDEYIPHSEPIESEGLDDGDLYTSKPDDEGISFLDDEGSGLVKTLPVFTGERYPSRYTS